MHTNETEKLYQNTFYSLCNCFCILHTHTYTHARAQARKHARTHTHTQTHTLAYQHTQAHPPTTQLQKKIRLYSLYYCEDEARPLRITYLISDAGLPLPWQWAKTELFAPVGVHCGWRGWWTYTCRPPSFLLSTRSRAARGQISVASSAPTSLGLSRSCTLSLSLIHIWRCRRTG